MLRRRVTGSASFVCLRCRLQLAETAMRLPFPAAAVASSHRSHRRRYGTHGTDAPAATEELDRRRASDHGNDAPNPETFYKAFQELEAGDHKKGKEDKKAVLPKRPLQEAESDDHQRDSVSGKLRFSQQRRPYEYKSRGRILSARQEGLSIDILGKPASAIVLTETPLKREYPKLPPDGSHVEVDPATLLPDQTNDAAAEVLIHELRPVDTSVLIEKDFVALKDTLVKGFTVAQLQKYFREWHAVKRVLPEEPAPDDNSHPWILGAPDWTPVSGNGTIRIPDSRLYGYVLPGMTGKERLAIRLMRECWGLSSSQGPDQQDGRLSATIRELEFNLLLRNQRLLGTIARTFPEAEISFIASTHNLVVKGPKPTAQAVFYRINQFLKQAQTEEFPVSLVSPNPIEPAILDAVGTLTNSVPRLDPSGEKIMVTWIQLSNRDISLENYAETVFRFLRHAFFPKSPASHSYSLEVVPNSLARGGRYLAEINCDQKLPWEERFNMWERWVASLPRSDSPSGSLFETHSSGVASADSLPFPLDPTQAIVEPGERVSHMLGWSSEPQTDTSAVFGHVVFASKQRPSDPPLEPGSESQLDLSRPRTFVPLLPPLDTLDLPSNLHETGLWHLTAVVRFAPDPTMSPDLVKAAPDLELYIEMDHREIKRITHLRAVMHTSTQDLLFPGCPVDARILQRRYFTLPGRHIERYASPVTADFMPLCDLKPKNALFKTPHYLKGISLPRRLLLPKYAELSSPTLEDNTTSPTINNNNNNNNNRAGVSADTVTVDYRLATIEVQRQVAAEYEGLKLRYSHIIAGKRGGLRAELSLEAAHVDPAHEDAEPKDAAPDGSSFFFPSDSESRSKRGGGHHFTSHSKNVPKEEREPRPPPQPVDVHHFLRVASEIASGEGRIKWFQTLISQDDDSWSL